MERLPSLVSVKPGVRESYESDVCFDPINPLRTVCAPCDAQSGKRPNIVIILVDDMGWSDIASYGGEISNAEPGRTRQTWRAVYAVLQHGSLQPDALRCSPGTIPSSRDGPSDNLIRQDSMGFQERSPTTRDDGRQLKASGYFTAMTGKWHLGQQNWHAPLGARL
jgi:arylsulfatase